MYCEQMMREHGFEDTPAHRVIVATDAIWRACRIILDIRLHRGEIGVDEAIDFLVEHTGFERPDARAEVHRYTPDAGYNLSYLLGKVALAAAAGRRAAAPGRGLLAAGVPRRAALLGQPAHQLPPSAAGGRGRRTHGAAWRGHRLMQVIPSLDIQDGRSRLVWWPGASSAPARRPTDRSRSPRAFVAQGAPAIHLVDLDGARQGRPANLEAIGAVARAVAGPCSWRAASTGRSRSSSPSPPARPASCCRCGPWRRTAAAGSSACASAGDWLAVGLDARPEQPARLPLAPPQRAQPRRACRRAQRCGRPALRVLPLPTPQPISQLVVEPDRAHRMPKSWWPAA